ncbi:MAG TPA: hypothetical protein VJ808_02760 [Gemmatimonadales bacterium]|nr:hypothetical protein [Gemmatimonadales bacterium]
MRVLQSTKRSVTLLAAVCLVLNGCGGDSGPEVPFNPTGTSEDIQAVNSAFASPVFASFSTFSMHFDAALGAAPLVSASAQLVNFRRATTAGELRAAAMRNAQRVAGLARTTNGSFSASIAAIPAEVAGKTYEYSGGSYIATDRPGAPANGVRFLIYAVNPLTFQPVEPLQEVGYVQLTDESGSSTQAARVVVVSGETTYLDYTVTATATTSGGRITVAGYVSDGTIRANINLRSTVTESDGLTLLYTVDVPQRDVSITLTMSMTGFDQESATINIDLGMSGPNGSVSMSGQLTETGGTLTVRVNGDQFATIASSGASEPTITGADGQPLTDGDVDALQGIFGVTGEAFIAFDAMVVPVGTFLAPSE